MDTGDISTDSEKKHPNWGGKRANSGRPPKKRESFEAAQRRKESALADLRQMEAELKRGKLLEADAVQREWEDVLRMVKAGVMSCVGRIRDVIPHLTPAEVQLIDGELRSALAALGEDKT